MFIGQKFPDVTTSAVLPSGTIVNDFNLHTYAENSYSVVFFYPLDFTFVCPTELVAFDALLPEFTARNTKVVSASVDSAHSHAAWRRTPTSEGGIGPVQYPMLSDFKREISSQLGILNPAGVTYRASYLLDQAGIIRHLVINDLPLGRNVEEMLRMIDSLQFTEQHGEVCPANWRKGNTGMQTSRESVAQHLQAVQNSTQSHAKAA